MPSLEQEIEWVKEEIDSDESVLASADASQFHRDRLRENQAKLQELLDLKD